MRNFNVGDAAAHRDRADVNIAVKDTPAFMAEFGVAAAGQLRHATMIPLDRMLSEAHRIE
jgi:hypothetical protein